MQLSLHSQYGKHIPKILRRQLILQLMEQYLNVHRPEESSSTSECKPSIQRFHGALLFVDISGFTALSTQLSPEDLKYHINEYFSKMLEIVDRHGGDVIKFAGDALFIVWETSHMMKGHSEGELREEGEETLLSFKDASRLAVSTAVECGLEINESCSNHKVSLLPRNASSDSSLSLSSSFSATSTCSTPNTPHPSFACLNVHSGVTVGLMAGIDIGCNDRWEYFLMGEPLTSVAMAEAQASTGEIVICPDAHDLLHPAVRPTFNRALARISIVHSTPARRFKRTHNRGSSKYDEIQDLKKHNFDDSAVDMPCGCLKGSNGYCKVKKGTKSPISHIRRNKLKSKFEEGIVFDETNREIEAVFDTFIGHRLSVLHSIHDIQQEFIKDISHTVTLNVAPIRYALNSVVQAAMNVKTLGDRVKAEFVKWAHSCLMDDIVRHVHDVARSAYQFQDTSRIDVCRREISKQLTTLNAPESVVKAKEKFRDSLLAVRMKKMETQASVMDSAKKFLRKTSSYGRLSINGRLGSGSSKSSRLFSDESAGFSAEIRTVTVMFVKIDMPHLDLTVEDPDHGEHMGLFGFLSKTVNESLADVLLLHQMQSCMEALNESLSSQGGQLRQFIVDDKGTVAIGTFGLRGAVSDDNAASAVETAFLIVNKLQALGLNCSIGLTMGKAFCGLVGSSNRHEYAVMGPSTNLSARLMCKAPLGGIICDREIRSVDRTHEFAVLADVIAKGYKQPVGTCKPLPKGAEESFSRLRFFKSDGSSSAIVDRRASVVPVDENGVVINRLLNKLLTGPYIGGLSDASKSNAVGGPLVGRDEDVRGILAFLFSPLVVGDEVKFSVDKPVRFAAVLGPQGVGKSSVLKAVSNKLSSIVLSGRHLAVDVFKTMMSGFQAAVPCSAWRYVIRDMMIKLYNVVLHKASSIRMLGGVTPAVDIDVHVAGVKTLLPEELRMYMSLLGYMKIVNEDVEAVKELQLSHDDMVLKCVELLNEIVRVYVTQCQRLVVIVAENVHSFDIASQLLLHQMCTSQVGVVVLFSAERTISVNKNNKLKHGAHATADIDGKLSVEDDCVTLLIKQDACFCLDLSLLPKEQIFTLIKIAFNNAGVASSDDRVMQKIYDESGGNPMYACELAKSVAQKHSEQIDLTRVSVKVTNCHRLEEIICHRFDQLSHSCQSLLKIAAAISHFGSSFTYDMLQYVMAEDEGESGSGSDEHVIADLLNIVNSESFLRVVGSDNEEEQQDALEFGGDITAEDIASNQYRFTFCIALERSTIYDLLLGDQKCLIHERIADYFHQQRQQETSQMLYVEEGLHWQLASRWSYAMSCSYHASLLESNSHKAGEYIDTAYRMYVAMKDQTRNETLFNKSAIGDFMYDNGDWEYEKKRALFDLVLSNSEDLGAINESSTMTASDVSDKFECDSELLVVCLKVIIARTRRNLRGRDTFEENRQVLEEALQMNLLTKNSRVLSTSKVTHLIELLAHHDTVDEASTDEGGVPTDYFTVGDEFVPVCLNLMSLMVLNYLQLDSIDELRQYEPTVKFVLEKYDMLRGGLGEVHELQALLLGVRLSCKNMEFAEACVKAEALVSRYKFDSHSCELIKLYGCDWVPSTVAMLGQYLLLSSEWSVPCSYVKLAQEVVLKMSHVESVKSGVYFVTNSLVFLRQLEAALEVFTHYLDCVAVCQRQRSMRDGIYLEWLKRLKRFSEYSQSKDTSLFVEDVEILNEFVQSKNHVMDDSAMIVLFEQGRTIESLLADVCALKIAVLWESETEADQKALRTYCKALRLYVRDTLAVGIGCSHEVLFGKTSAVLTVLWLLQYLSGASVSFMDIEELVKESLQVSQRPEEHSVNVKMADVCVPASQTTGPLVLELSSIVEPNKMNEILASEDPEEQPDKPSLMLLLLGIIDDSIIDGILNDYQQQHPMAVLKVPQLIVNVFVKIKNEWKLSIGTEESTIV